MASAAIAFVGTADWNVEVYDALSLSARLSALIQSHTAQLKLAMFFWNVNRKIESFQKHINAIVARTERGEEITEQQNATQADIEHAIRQLWDLHALLKSIYTMAIRCRLNNWSRLAAGIERLKANMNWVAELALWIDDVVHPSHEGAFANALAELENGETVPAHEVWR